MVDGEEVLYIEEKDIGLDLIPALFEPSNRKFCAISGKDGFSYDTESGKRLKMFRHSDCVIGLHFINKKLLSITKKGTVTEWDLSTGAILSTKNIALDVELLWTYELNNSSSDYENSICVFGQKLTLSNGKCELMDIDESSSDASYVNSTSLFRLKFDNESSSVQLKQMVEVVDRITSKQQLAVSSNFAVVAAGRVLKILPFSLTKLLVNGPLSFTHRTKILTLENDCLAFDEVQIIGDSVYASLNIGRLYFWSRVYESGLDHNSKTFINVRNCAFTFAISSHRTLFTGDGECCLAKWNLATSGVGRWHRAEYLDVESPVERLLLSADSTHLVAVLADNAVYVVKTATMTIISQAQVLNWNSTVSPFDWAKLVIDPVHPDYVVANARLGHIQWIDPAKWRTVATYDVCEENSPPKDHFNLPDYLWLNVYLIHFTANRFVTCECRRNDPNRTYFKIYQRITSGSMTDFRLEECITYPRRVSFVRSNFDDFMTSVNSEDELSTIQEFLRVDCDGRIDVFVPDQRRAGRWRVDENRLNVTFHKCVVHSCSRVRNEAFATVNEANSVLDSKLGDSSNKQNVVLLWRLPVALQIFQVVECVPDVRQVEWAPSSLEAKSILLMAGYSDLTGYSPETASVLWKVRQPNISLFSSQLFCFAYNAKKVIWFDPIQGKLKKVQTFSRPQQLIVATGNQTRGNICVSGLSDKNLSVLKRDIPDNAVLCDISFGAKKKTPFSKILSKNCNGFIIDKSNCLPLVNSVDCSNNGTERNQTTPTRIVKLQSKVPSAAKTFDGPAYTLPPITELASRYIQSCMLIIQKE